MPFECLSNAFFLSTSDTQVLTSTLSNPFWTTFDDHDHDTADVLKSLMKYTSVQTQRRLVTKYILFLPEFKDASPYT